MEVDLTDGASSGRTSKAEIGQIRSVSLITAYVRTSARAAGGVLSKSGRLCTGHRPLAINAADRPL